MLLSYFSSSPAARALMGRSAAAYSESHTTFSALPNPKHLTRPRGKTELLALPRFSLLHRPARTRPRVWIFSVPLSATLTVPGDAHSGPWLLAGFFRLAGCHFKPKGLVRPPLALLEWTHPKRGRLFHQLGIALPNPFIKPPMRPRHEADRSAGAPDTKASMLPCVGGLIASPSRGGPRHPPPNAPPREPLPRNGRFERCAKPPCFFI